MYFLTRIKPIFQVTFGNPPTISKPFDSYNNLHSGSVWTSPKPIGSAKERQVIPC